MVGRLSRAARTKRSALLSELLRVVSSQEGPPCGHGGSGEAVSKLRSTQRRWREAAKPGAQAPGMSEPEVSPERAAQAFPLLNNLCRPFRAPFASSQPRVSAASRPSPWALLLRAFSAVNQANLLLSFETASGEPPHKTDLLTSVSWNIPTQFLLLDLH